MNALDMKRHPPKLLKRGAVIGAAVGMLLLQGCVPGTFRTNHSAAYQGRIIDAERQQPIRNAKVELEGPGLKASAKTDKNGIYRVGPLYCRRICLYVAAPEGVWPQECSHIFPDNLRLNLSASCSGYVPTNLLVPLFGTNYSRQATIEDVLLQPKHWTQ
jgi:hypothetical protein